MLIPIAIAINIVLGQTVAAALKLPVYLDSIGTILVGVLAGPIPGAVTGVLSNLIWTYVLPAPFHSDYAAPFFYVAALIGFVAGIVGHLGFFRSRPNTPWSKLAGGAIGVTIILVLIGFYGFLPFYTEAGLIVRPIRDRREPVLHVPRLGDRHRHRCLDRRHHRAALHPARPRCRVRRSSPGS